MGAWIETKFLMPHLARTWCGNKRFLVNHIIHLKFITIMKEYTENQMKFFMRLNEKAESVATAQTRYDFKQRLADLELLCDEIFEIDATLPSISVTMTNEEVDKIPEGVGTLNKVGADILIKIEKYFQENGIEI